MTASTIGLSAAWAFLVGATLLTFRVAGDGGGYAIVMGIAAAKVIVVLHRFMDLGRVPLPLRLFLYGWTIGCAAMIGGLAITSG